MGFRFRRSFKIVPGVRINVSKGGVSTSLGHRGATVNISNRGARGNVAIPGTGVSYSAPLDQPEPTAGSWVGTIILLIALGGLAAYLL